MRNTIKYFYNIEIENIRQNNNRYIFNDAQNMYSFEDCKDYISNINDIYNLNKFMVYNSISVYPIIPNRLNEVVTYVNNVPYLLMRIDVHYADKIDISDLLINQVKVDATIAKGLVANNWKALWANKIDYIEYQVNQFGLRYPLIRESMGYFVGMSENAICMLNETKELKGDLYLQHRRIRCSSSKYDMLNPLNIIIDVRVRDLTEYYKSCFTESESNIESIYKYITMQNYDSYDLFLLYIRMYFPTIYFDRYENVVLNGDSEKKIQEVIDKVNQYERFLHHFSNYINQYIYIPNIEWIRKIEYKKT